MCWQSGGGGSRRGVARSSLVLKLNLEGISSIITRGRTSSPNTKGENLELSIAFPASSLRLYNNVFKGPQMLEVAHLIHAVAVLAGCVLTGSHDREYKTVAFV